MLKANSVLRNLPGVISPFLCASQPQILGDVLKQGRTKENIDLVMREVTREHFIGERPIFQETKELVSASAQLDPQGHSKRILNFVNERRTNLPLFEVFLSNANDIQKHEALKLAMSNDDMDSVKRILPYLKNEQKTLDQLFVEFRNTKQISNDMIRDLLPRCSESVQSRYLNEMIIQRNRPAVLVIIKFFKPTDDHRRLAKIHFSSASSSIFARPSEMLKKRVLVILPGFVNVSFNPLSNVKEAGKQLVMTARETAKAALRRMGLLAGPTELVAFEGNTHLENLNGLTFGQGNDNESFEEIQLALPASVKALLSGRTSLGLNVGQAFLSTQTLIAENARRVLTVGAPMIEEFEEETGETFALPRVFENTSEEQGDGFGRNAAATVAALGLGAMLDNPEAKEMNEQPAKVEIAPKKTLEDIVDAAVAQPALAMEEKAPVVKDLAPVIEDLAPVMGPRAPSYWQERLSQMERDRKKGSWTL